MADVMRVLQVIIITIQVSGSFSKKKNRDLSSESIENILYYKDCNHRQKPTITPLMMNPPQPQQECKMCCTMCCGDQCVDSHQMKLGRQAGHQVEPKLMPIQPDVVQPRERRKKQNIPLPMQPPLPGRRDIGTPAFTRESIKSLISQDVDIRRILRELVRVTMQKADLMQMMRGQHPAPPTPAQTYDNDSDNDL